LMSMSKYWVARNPPRVSKWSDISTSGLLFQWASTIIIQLSILVLYKADIFIIIIISSKCHLFLSWYCWKMFSWHKTIITHSLPYGHIFILIPFIFQFLHVLTIRVKIMEPVV
jgi:hypothetical protein